MGREPSMLKTRVIPVLLLREGRMVKGRRFKDFRDTGDPVSAARVYNHQDADELMFIDIDASRPGKAKDRPLLYQVIERVSKECFMPLCVGGGVDSIGDIVNLLKAGADKVMINSSGIERPELIREASLIFGAQCITVGVDVRKVDGKNVIHTQCGEHAWPELDLVEYIKVVEALGAGELFINSIDQDGMMGGYDLELLELVRQHTSLPVVACGGAGHFKDLVDALLKAHVHAVACASLFHFGDNSPLRAKAYLKNHGIVLKKI